MYYIIMDFCFPTILMLLYLILAIDYHYTMPILLCVLMGWECSKIINKLTKLNSINVWFDNLDTLTRLFIYTLIVSPTFVFEIIDPMFAVGYCLVILIYRELGRL